MCILRISSAMYRLEDLLEEGISPETKVGFIYDDKINYIAPVSAWEKEGELIHFSAGKFERDVFKEDNLDNFIDNIISHCNRCSLGDYDCDKYECSLKITPLVNCNEDKAISPVFGIKNIEYNKDEDVVMLELSEQLEDIAPRVMQK